MIVKKTLSAKIVLSKKIVVQCVSLWNAPNKWSRDFPRYDIVCTTESQQLVDVGKQCSTLRHAQTHGCMMFMLGMAMCLVAQLVGSIGHYQIVAQ